MFGPVCPCTLLAPNLMLLKHSSANRIMAYVMVQSSERCLGLQELEQANARANAAEAAMVPDASTAAIATEAITSASLQAEGHQPSPE